VVSPAGVIQALKYSVPAVIIAFVLFGLVRPAMRDLMRAGQLAQAGPGGPVEPQLSAAGYGPGREGAFEADLKAVKDMAKQEPRIVANVVKDWVGRDE
jgi:flagellar M-ring protein FliF